MKTTDPVKTSHIQLLKCPDCLFQTVTSKKAINNIRNTCDFHKQLTHKELNT